MYLFLSIFYAHYSVALNAHIAIFTKIFAHATHSPSHSLPPSLLTFSLFLSFPCVYLLYTCYTSAIDNRMCVHILLNKIYIYKDIIKNFYNNYFFWKIRIYSPLFIYLIIFFKNNSAQRRLIRVLVVLKSILHQMRFACALWSIKNFYARGD